MTPAEEKLWIKVFMHYCKSYGMKEADTMANAAIRMMRVSTVILCG